MDAERPPEGADASIHIPASFVYILPGNMLVMLTFFVDTCGDLEALQILNI